MKLQNQELSLRIDSLVKLDQQRADDYDKEKAYHSKVNDSKKYFE